MLIGGLRFPKCETLKAARVHGMFPSVVDLTDLTGLKWDQKGAALGCHRFVLFRGENCLLTRNRRKTPAGDPHRGQPSSMHYAGVKFNNERMGNDTWRPGFIKEAATGRGMFFPPHWGRPRRPCDVAVVSSPLETSPSAEILKILQNPRLTASPPKAGSHKRCEGVVRNP